MTVPSPARSVRREAALQRREQLLAVLRERGATPPPDLAAALQVTVMTVHRDLVALERLGVVDRQRGRVSMLPSQLYTHRLGWRDTQQRAAKRRLATAALKLMKPGSIVGIDDSTTTSRLVDLLVGDPPPCQDLTVVTSSLRHAQAVARGHDVVVQTGDDYPARLLLVGGSYKFERDAFHGHQAVADLSKLRLDLAVVSATSLHADAGARADDPDVAATTAALLVAADRRVLLIDASKLGQPPAAHCISTAEDFDDILIATTNTTGPIGTHVLARAGALGHGRSRVTVLPWQLDLAGP